MILDHHRFHKENKTRQACTRLEKRDTDWALDKWSSIAKDYDGGQMAGRMRDEVLWLSEKQPDHTTSRDSLEGPR